MAREFSFSVSSNLNVSRQALWQTVTRMPGVNYELMPFVAMTYPSAYKQNSIEQAPLNKVVFNSILLLFGFIPFDVHSLKIEKLQPGYFFQEHSSSLMHKDWKHRRILEDMGNGTTVTDYIVFAPRLSCLGMVLRHVLKYVFTNRHKRLQKKYGSMG
jgi:ligand-binding SRPBCC domain-containing protein